MGTTGVTDLHRRRTGRLEPDTPTEHYRATMAGSDEQVPFRMAFRANHVAVDAEDLTLWIHRKEGSVTEAGSGDSASY